MAPGKRRSREPPKIGSRPSAKAEVMGAYGGACSCCGETEMSMLTIDHVNNDGYLEREENGRRSQRLHKRIKAEGYPERYQCLCSNCNLSKHINGGVYAHKLAMVQVLSPARYWSVLLGSNTHSVSPHADDDNASVPQGLT